MSKYILLLIASLTFMTFLLGCGNGGNISALSLPVVETWNGIWVSNSVVASGTVSMTITRSDTAFSGSITMSGSSCFVTSTITGWTVTGNTVSWSSPEIGNFTGTVSGASISGTYSVPPTTTAASACFGDSGVFSVTST